MLKLPACALNFPAKLDCTSPFAAQLPQLERLSLRWELIAGGHVGEGSVGTVGKARPRGGGPTCAVKTVSKIDCSRAMALREADVLRSLDHPSICHLLDTCEDGESIHLVLEYVEGHELFEEIKPISGGGDERLAARIIAQVLEALAYCHDHEVVHRDLKPENIMVHGARDAPRATLIDFGLALEAGEFCDGPEGTEVYMAPEARCSQRVDKPMDLWSVGVVLHTLLTGQILPEAVQLGQRRLDPTRRGRSPSAASPRRRGTSSPVSCASIPPSASRRGEPWHTRVAG